MSKPFGIYIKCRKHIFLFAFEASSDPKKDALGFFAPNSHQEIKFSEKLGFHILMNIFSGWRKQYFIHFQSKGTHNIWYLSIDGSYSGNVLVLKVLKIGLKLLQNCCRADYHKPLRT